MTTFGTPDQTDRSRGTTLPSIQGREFGSERADLFVQPRDDGLVAGLARLGEGLFRRGDLLAKGGLPDGALVAEMDDAVGTVIGDEESTGGSDGETVGSFERAVRRASPGVRGEVRLAEDDVGVVDPGGGRPAAFLYPRTRELP